MATVDTKYLQPHNVEKAESLDLDGNQYIVFWTKERLKLTVI